MKLKAYAKINVTLSVLGKRPDGFHELVSLMQNISLADDLEIARTEMRGIQFSCSSGVTDNIRDNLVHKAADTYFTCSEIPPAVTIKLTKNIPQAAGMGGGSSDAAATLVALNELYENRVSTDRLCEIAAGLGSDVPFFLTGGTAVIKGRGEIVEKQPFLGDYSILLINPGFSVPTSLVFSSLNLDLTSKRPLHNILPALGTGLVPVSKLKKYVHNDLEPVVLKLFPKIDEPLQWLRKNGAEVASVSGSGGTVFGIYSDFESAREAETAAQELFPWVYLAKTIASGPLEL